MIAKNEEKYIEQCLSSVKDIVDEIIIVDTGSTDRTKEICKNFDANGVKIFDFKWIDDFSAARNESLKHATKDWILVLDADEVLDEEGAKTIKEITKDKEPDAFLFLQKNYTNDTSIAGFVTIVPKPSEKDFENQRFSKPSLRGFVSEEHKKNGKTYAGWYGSYIARLFRNKKGYQFEGTVHELVEPSIEEKEGKLAVTNIILHHYGNSEPSVVKKKREFYLELCKKKVKEKPSDTSYFELGVLQKENNKLDDAIKSFKKVIELNQKYNMALFELGVIYEQQKNFDEAIKNYTASLRIKENSEAFQNLGVCYLKKEKYEDAYINLTKAMLLNPNKYTIYNNLGAVLEKSGNLETAAQMLEIAVKLNPKNTIGFYNLGIVLDKKGDFENAMKNYEKAIELGHKKSDEIKKRINQLKVIIANTPSYKYGFKVGG